MEAKGVKIQIRLVLKIIFGIFLIILLGCSEAGFDSAGNANALQKQYVLDAVNIALSTGDCATALAKVYPIYNSSVSDTDIRLATAASYGCSAGISVFTVIDNLISFPEPLGGPGFWDFLVFQFPSVSSPDDKKPTAALLGLNALFSTINPGTILASPYLVNSGTVNPGSLLTADRTSDANTYLMFMGMSLMGTLMNRYGSPSANHHKGNPVPWTTPATAKGDGCRFASGLLNFYDGITYIGNNAPSQVQSIYNSITSFLSSSLDQACALGCTLNGCNSVCSNCPTTLRYGENCTGVNTDANSCAAAGLATFLNSSWAGPP